MNESLKCPFLATHAVDCVYMTDLRCDDIDICPGNSYSWCLAHIEAAAGRRAPNPLLPLVRELRDAALAIYTTMTGVHSPCDAFWKHKMRALRKALARADKALAGEQGEVGK